MWSNDFPHPNSTWPNSRKIIERDLGHLSAETQRKVVCDNVSRLYNIDASKLPRIQKQAA
jgi:predicted TIM-barrel fold metal-dependent hydrolase